MNLSMNLTETKDYVEYCSYLMRDTRQKRCTVKKPEKCRHYAKFENGLCAYHQKNIPVCSHESCVNKVAYKKDKCQKHIDSEVLEYRRTHPSKDYSYGTVSWYAPCRYPTEESDTYVCRDYADYYRSCHTKDKYDRFWENFGDRTPKFVTKWKHIESLSAYQRDRDKDLYMHKKWRREDIRNKHKSA